MKHRPFRLIFVPISVFWILCFGFCASSPGRDIGYTEDPTKIGIGARPLGMGRAFVAIADQENAVFINPAGLSYTKKWSLSSMYASFLGDVNYITFGFTYPLPLFRNGGVGIGYVGSNVPGIISPTQEGFNYSDYHNNVYLIAASFSPRDDLSFGSALKIFDQGFSGYVNSIGKGYDLDLGVKWDIDKRLGLGLNLQNILPVSMGGKISWPNGDEQSIPAVAKAGLKGLTEDGSILFAVDYDLQINKNLPGTGHIGAEWKFHPNLALRGGLDQNLSAMTGNTATNVSLGIGLEIGSVKFDYAYHPYFDESSNITHYISFTIFGRAPALRKTQTVAPTPEAAPKAIKAATPEAEPKEMVYKVICGPFTQKSKADRTNMDAIRKGLDSVVKEDGPGKWTVQLGVFSLEDNAAKLRDLAGGKGIKSIVITTPK